jgi:trehalose synthase
MTALQPMAVPHGSLEAHEAAAGAEAVARVRRAAEPLEGARVLHVTAAVSTGRTPELLAAALPLAADAGVEPDWRVLFGEGHLRDVARQLHDGLQGAETAIDDAAWAGYTEACERAAAELPDHDVLVAHDPAALGVAAAAAGASGRTAWRCHVDASKPDRRTWERAKPLVEACGAVLTPAADFVPDDLDAASIRAAAPGIDPLSARNLELAPRLAGRVVRPLGIDLERPFVVMLQRLDRWKDPHGVLDAHARACEETPGLQLVLGGALAVDDPIAWNALAEITDYAGGREDVHLLTSYAGLGDLELGALQRLARVSVHRALREGFGLAAAEALWRGTPVVGRPDGGIALQLDGGVGGRLADGVDAMAAAIVELVRDPGLAIELGREGRGRVREQYLVTSAVEAELRALATIG